MICRKEILFILKTSCKSCLRFLLQYSNDFDFNPGITR